MSYYFGHSKALTKVIGYRILHFSFPNGYTAKVSRNCEYPNSDNWKATLMCKGREIHDTAIYFNGTYLARGETSAYISSDEVEAYLKAVNELPMRLH